VLISRLEWAAVLSLGVFVFGCCKPDETPTAEGSDGPASQKKVLVQEDPEPAAGGFKPLRPACTEPIVQLLPAQGEHRPDASDITEQVRDFVRTNREFASPTINYAETSLEGASVLLARCPDSETANRLARKIKVHSRVIRAVPVCGFASSGWTTAKRTLQLP
jgi:hypothetical protein